MKGGKLSLDSWGRDNLNLLWPFCALALLLPLTSCSLSFPVGDKSPLRPRTTHDEALSLGSGGGGVGSSGGNTLGRAIQ